MLGMHIRSEFNLNSPNSPRIRSQRDFAANWARHSEYREFGANSAREFASDRRRRQRAPFFEQR